MQMRVVSAMPNAAVANCVKFGIDASAGPIEPSLGSHRAAGSPTGGDRRAHPASLLGSLAPSTYGATTQSANFTTTRGRKKGRTPFPRGRATLARAALREVAMAGTPFTLLTTRVDKRARSCGAAATATPLLPLHSRSGPAGSQSNEDASELASRGAGWAANARSWASGMSLMGRVQVPLARSRPVCCAALPLGLGWRSQIPPGSRSSRIDAGSQPAPALGHFADVLPRSSSLRSANGVWVAGGLPVDELLRPCAGSNCRWCSLSWQYRQSNSQLLPSAGLLS